MTNASVPESVTHGRVNQEHRLLCRHDRVHHGCTSISATVVVVPNDCTRSLKKLRLSGMSQTLEVRLQEAAGNWRNHVELLELVLQD